MVRLMVLAVTLAVVASFASAHGGYMRGPAGEVPPNLRKPTDPPPPNNPETPTPPEEEPGGTTTPGPDDRGELPPAPPGGPGGSQGRPMPAPGTGGNDGSGTPTPNGRPGNARPVVTFDSWLFWWGYNNDDILNLRARLRSLENRTSTRLNPVGVGEHHGRTPGGKIAVTDLAIRERVVPALEAALDSSLFFDIRAGAVVGLGKIGATQEKAVASRIAERLLAILANESGEEHGTVEESAALALGLLQSRDVEIVDALCDVLNDRRGARTRTRSFAALALGLLGVESSHPRYARVAETLRDVVRSGDETQADVPACALVAMGLSGDAAFVPALVEMTREGRAYGTRKLDDLLRSFAAAALGKIAERDRESASPAVVEVLGRALTRKGTHTTRSAVIALGQIAQRRDLAADVRRRIVKQLAYVTGKGETQAANFATVALGRIGGATDDARLRGHIGDVLRRQLKKGSFVSRPFAALGLGLLGRRFEDAAAIGELLRDEFVEYRGDPRGRGAYAIALGMLGDRRAVPVLLGVLEDEAAYKKLRGLCAVALGMIRDRKAIPAIRTALLEDRDPDLRVDAAIGAGLVGEIAVIDDLIGILRDPRASLYVQGSVVLSLGRIGDERAIDSIIEILEDEEAQDIKRALAAVALGLLGDRNDLPVLGRLSKDVNYRAQVNALLEVLSIL